MKSQTKKHLLIIGIMLALFCICMQKIYYSMPEEIKENYSFLDVYAEDADLIAKPICTASSIQPTWDIVEEVEPEYDEETVEVLTNLLYGEARGVKSKAQRAAVIWVVLNRFDNGHYGNSIIEVATAPNQFLGYKKDRIYKDTNAYNNCKELVVDVLDRYYLEKSGVKEVGRTIPSNYLYFYSPKGQDNINKFTSQWRDYSTIWDWSLPNPYID